MDECYESVKKYQIAVANGESDLSDGRGEAAGRSENGELSMGTRFVSFDRLDSSAKSGASHINAHRMLNFHFSKHFSLFRQRLKNHGVGVSLMWSADVSDLFRIS